MSDAVTPDAPRPGSTVAPGVDSPSNTDDSPTIISIQKPQPVVVERFDASLRGRRLGSYELIEPIGAGGMAAVLRAIDVSLGRTVALKILTPELARDPDHVARFQSEARAAAKLDHANIARVYGCGEDQGLHFIAFEFVDGATLRELIDLRGMLPVADALPLMVQIAEGLSHAAERGVVHRDVKPSNIIVAPDGRAKMVDMGLARHLDGAAGGVTQSGVTLGTFDYISPEQALEPRTADARSDIYSLGCTFYHALTGQPPVPEGTAARKLQHHQIVAPPDPRTLNPAIPDAVAAVLARMMAKDPRDRYQHPDHLVHDLRALTQTLEPSPKTRPSSAEIQLWANTPPPSAPSRMPLMMGAAASLGVAVLVAVLEMTRPPSGPGFHIAPPGGRSVVEAPADAPAAGGDIRAKSEMEPPRPAETVHAVATVAELRELFAEAEPVLRIRLTGLSYDLSSSDGIEPAGLIFSGKRLEMEPEDPTRIVTIHFAPSQDDRAALTLAGGDGERVEVLMRGVRFQCDVPTSDRPIAAIVGSDVHQIDLERCAFILPDGAPGARGAAALALDDRDPRDAPTIRLNECLFVRGSQAVQLAGRGSINAVNCAFGPHHALVHLRGTGPETAIRFEHCSALLENTAVVLLDDGASARIAAGHCVFSRATADPLDDAPIEAVVIRQVGGKAGDVTYRGLMGPDRLPLRNAYHNLSAFWSDETAGGPRLSVTLDDARGRPSFHDDDALELPQSPWLDQRPLARLAAGDERGAFAINLKLARLRLPRSPQAGTLGTQRNVWGPSFVKLEPVGGPTDTAAIRSRIVDPSHTEADFTQGIYPTLAHALLDARPNELILIKKNGPLPIEPTLISKADAKLTLRPFPGYRPVLTFGMAGETDAAMFRINDGSVKFENLQFVLRPAKSEFRSQALVAIAGAGQATFHECVVTLEESADVQLAAVVLPEVEGVWRSNDRRGAPTIRFETCFVRGKGDLLTVRGGRRFELELDCTLAALDGSLVTAAGSLRDSPSVLPSQIRLRKVTAALSEHLVSLRLGRDEEKHPVAIPTGVQVTSDGSLLAAMAGRALVQVDGADSDEQVRQLISWSTPAEAKPTYYANAGPTLLDVQPANPERMPLPGPYDRERWLTFTHDRTSDPFVRMRFATAPPAFAQPSDYRPRWLDANPPPGADDCGAPVDRLPASAGDDALRPPSPTTN